jgi:Na+-translocating ferredoxin:NAD+ oxidoreductase RnfE subunit
MNELSYKRLIWGKNFPLASLSGAALLIMASDRLAHALVVTLALVWVYCLSALAVFAGKRFFPKEGRFALIISLTSFIAGLYFLLLWIIAPFCALQIFFVIPLIPIICISSEVFKRLETTGLKETIRDSVSESLIYAVLIVIFALIREPLGFSSLSLPGGAQGIIMLFSFGGSGQLFLPIRIIASSSGALLLLGYLIGVYRQFKNIHAPEENG